jgi:hypothetical protein
LIVFTVPAVAIYTVTVCAVVELPTFSLELKFTDGATTVSVAAALVSPVKLAV